MVESRPQRPQDDEAASPQSPRPVFVEISGTELTRRAAQVGKVAGTAVAVFRDARRRLSEPGQAGDDRFSQFGATASTRMKELRREAADRVEDWRRAVLDRTAELRREAKTGYDQARQRARQIGRDYPVHVVVAAGVVGFLIGAGMRMRRANRGN
ncbi:MAG TPA: hypothetical protein VI488_08875 [Candidatus Angelobacter sp.]